MDKVIKRSAPCFVLEYYSNDDLFFFPYAKVKKFDIVSADTETKLYYNEKLLDDGTSSKLFKDNGQQWFKENVEVKAYAYTLSTGKGFALFQCAKDFLTACAMLNVKVVVWYNAKFDFSIFDYYLLSNGWKNATERIKDNKKQYQHLQDKTYTSLENDFGQRYQMTIWKSYINQNSKKVTHKFKMIDLCNISGGGLAKNLESYEIVDEDGNSIRKLTMDYSNGSIEDDIQYMINDVKGLYYLAKKISEEFESVTNLSFLNCDYLTAGGLAIKTLLNFMYGKDNHNLNKKAFQSEFYMTPEMDKDFRSNHLYLGGKCLVNPFKRGILQKQVYKYDVNSMYPAMMNDMLYPVGKPFYSKVYNKNDNRLKVLFISNLCATVKSNKIPIFQDFRTGLYDKYLMIDEPFYIWEEELNELEKWYDLSYTTQFCLYYNGEKNTGVKKFIDTFYAMKRDKEGAQKSCAKLLLNSSYGKIAQRIERVKGAYEMSELGYVHYVKKGVEMDKKSMLSVLVGSRITALARVTLMQYIRKICNENVKGNFLYCDTDSVHALCEYKGCDDKALGKMKNEGIFKYAIYLAPKTYLMQDFENKYEVHCKGVNTKVVANELHNKSIIEACEIFNANKTFKTLCGVNCKGGKALVNVEKMILNDKNYTYDATIASSENGIFIEV